MDLKNPIKGKAPYKKMVTREQIKPHPNNVKVHPDHQVEKLRGGIDSFGYLQEIVVDEKNIIILGHGRYLSLEELPVEEKFEVTVKEGLTEDEKMQLMIFDNKIVSNEWNEEVLAKELPKLKALGLETGFGEKEIKDLALKMKDEPELEEEPAYPLTPQLHENYNYLMLFFKDELDFTYAKQLLKIKKAADRMKRDVIGWSRAIDGMEAIKLLQASEGMPEPE